MWTNYSSICWILPKQIGKIHNMLYLETLNFIRRDTLKCVKKKKIIYIYTHIHIYICRGEKTASILMMQQCMIILFFHRESPV